MARGSITKRSGKTGVAWRVRYDVPTADGERKQVSETVRTRKEAEALLARRQHELRSGSYVEPTTTTVGAFFADWLSLVVATREESTAYSYESIARNRILPTLGALPLAKLTPAAIQGLYLRLLDEGKAPKTVRLTHTVVRQAMAQAVAWKMIARNPAEGVQLPGEGEPTDVTWSPAEVRTFLAGTRDDRFGALYALALDAGMRLGELLALNWADVDLDRGVVAVRRTVSRTREGGWKQREGAKTMSGRRPIVLAAPTVMALRVHRVQQAERRLALGPAWAAGDLVFDRDGAPCPPNAARDAFDRAVATSGLPRITPHGMRHTMATMLLGAGVHPKIVQERLGHRTIAMTLDRYSHVTMDMQKGAAAALTDLLSDPVELARERIVTEQGELG